MFVQLTKQQTKKAKKVLKTGAFRFAFSLNM